MFTKREHANEFVHARNVHAPALANIYFNVTLLMDLELMDLFTQIN